MGNGSSLPGSQQIDKKTHTTISVMNQIVHFVLTNMDFRDMLSLADPNEQQKWIIIAQTGIADLFDKINIEPQLGDDGIFYVRKKKALLQQQASRTEYTILAFFFIRLFQVVGALAFSVLDSNIPAKDYDLTSPMGVTKGDEGIPFFEKLSSTPKKKFGLFGGDLSNDQKFGILKIYLQLNEDGTYSLLTPPQQPRLSGTVPQTTINGIKIIYTNNILTFVIADKSPIQFDLDIVRSKIIINNVIVNNKSSIFEEQFQFTEISDVNNILVRLRNSEINFPNFILTLKSNIASLPPSQTLQVLNKFNYLEPSHVSGYADYNQIRNTNFPTQKDGIFVKNDDTSDIPTFLFAFTLTKDSKDYLIKIKFTIGILKKGDIYMVKISDLENILDSQSKVDFEPSFQTDKDEDTTSIERNFTVKGIGFSSEPTYNTQTIPRFLEKQLSKLILQASNIVSVKRTSVRFPPDNSKADAFLKYTNLWKILARDPPIKSFCTARALQLLNASGLAKQMPDKIQPLLYSTKFDLVVEHSLPTPGQPITTSYSIDALKTLYQNMDKWTARSKKGSRSSGSSGIFSSLTDPYSDPQYDDDMKKQSLGKLLVSFLDANGQNPWNIIEPEGATPSSFDVKTNTTKAVYLRNQAASLFTIQFEHTKKVNTLLNKIFIISNSISLRPNILAKGILGIEQIASEARDLLSDYYANCQSTFNLGVQALTDPNWSKNKTL